MVQYKKSIILITVIGLAILFSGCVGKQAGTPTPIPTETPAPTVSVTVTTGATNTPTETSTPAVTTPAPAKTAPLLYGALYVTVRMKKPANLVNGSYELSSLQATITNTLYQPISLKAQIISDNQVLEEQSFTLQSGSSTNFANSRTYTISSTNVSLWLTAQGYQPTEYKVTTIYT